MRAFEGLCRNRRLIF
jgi:hypothetical protein